MLALIDLLKHILVCDSAPGAPDDFSKTWFMDIEGSFRIFEPVSATDNPSW
jgi:hypothetical protein